MDLPRASPCPAAHCALSRWGCPSAGHLLFHMMDIRRHSRSAARRLGVHQRVAAAHPHHCLCSCILLGCRNQCHYGRRSLVHIAMPDVGPIHVREHKHYLTLARKIHCDAQPFSFALHAQPSIEPNFVALQGDGVLADVGNSTPFLRSCVPLRTATICSIHAARQG